eukprot:344564-Amphidinium_carterae.2
MVVFPFPAGGLYLQTGRNQGSNYDISIPMTWHRANGKAQTQRYKWTSTILKVKHKFLYAVFVVGRHRSCNKILKHTSARTRRKRSKSFESVLPFERENLRSALTSDSILHDSCCQDATEASTKLT